MKQLLIAFFAVVTFWSCNKENDVDPLAGTRLVEQRTGDEYVKLQYGSNGKIVKAIVLDQAITDGEEVTYNIAYNTAGRISEVTASNGEKIRTEYANNRLVKAVVLEDNQEKSHTIYQYENGLLKTAEIKVSFLGQTFTSMKFGFSYDAQQRVNKTDFWMVNPLTDELEYAGRTLTEYDSKKNPLYEFDDFLLLMWQVPAENNVVKETQFLEDNTLDEVREFIFTYNAKNYPVQAIMRTTSNGSSQDITLGFVYN